MKRFKSCSKILRLFLHRKFVTVEDIGNSYDKISKEYENKYLQTMHIYNDEVLRQAVDLLKPNQKLRILDLACGTGYNINFIKKINPNCKFDAVDISDGMLKQVIKDSNVNYHQINMLSFLKQCNPNQYDLILCSWAIKYQNPQKIIKECFRVLKNHGIFAVIVNTKQTLPEVRKVYPRLLENNTDKIQKLMFELPNPKNESQLNHWAEKSGFYKKISKSSSHVFKFETAESAVEFVTSTGALAGFDVMLDLHNKDIKNQISDMFKQIGTNTITHNFVYGVYEK